MAPQGISFIGAWAKRKVGIKINIADSVFILIYALILRI
jgi:hypothetical protein